MASRGDRWDTWDSRALFVELTALPTCPTFGTLGGGCGASAQAVSECPPNEGQIPPSLSRRESRPHSPTVPTVPRFRYWAAKQRSNTSTYCDSAADTVRRRPSGSCSGPRANASHGAETASARAMASRTSMPVCPPSSILA